MGVDGCPGSMFPVAGILVFLLYLLLLHEIVTILFLKYGDRCKRGSTKGKSLLSRKSCNECQTKRTTSTLDALWRRMRKAKEYFRAVSSQRDQVTRHMAETKMEARELLRRRILEKRSRLLNLRRWDTAEGDSRED